MRIGVLGRNTCEYVFGDSITSLSDTGSGVHVTFARAAHVRPGRRRRRHPLERPPPRVRAGTRLRPPLRARDPSRTFPDLPGTGLMDNEPGRMVALGGPKAQSFFVFASGEPAYDRYATDIELPDYAT